MSDSAHIRSLLDGVTDYITSARAILAKGDFIELEGLDDQVKSLCDEIGKLSVTDSREFKDDLDALMVDLEALQQMFIQSRDMLAQELGGVNKHKQASLAYKQSEHAPVREGLSDPAADSKD